MDENDNALRDEGGPGGEGGHGDHEGSKEPVGHTKHTGHPELKATLEQGIETYNRRAPADPDLGAAIQGKTRRVNLNITDGEPLHFLLEGVVCQPITVGKFPEPDITMEADTETFLAVLNGDLGPSKALFTRRLRIKASLMDMMLIRKFFR
jgi:predicted lipid carrier protein YhbT